MTNEEEFEKIAMDIVQELYNADMSLGRRHYKDLNGVISEALMDAYNKGEESNNLTPQQLSDNYEPVKVTVEYRGIKESNIGCFEPSIGNIGLDLFISSVKDRAMYAMRKIYKEKKWKTK